MPEKTFSTKQVIQLTGLSKDTLRFYEKMGVIDHINRDKNGYRQYSQDDIDWLIIVNMMKKIKVPIKEFIGQQASPMIERVNFLRKYQNGIKSQISELQEIDTFLDNKINYLSNL